MYITILFSSSANTFNRVAVVSDVSFEKTVSRFGGTPESASGKQLETDARPPRAYREDEYQLRTENRI